MTSKPSRTCEQLIRDAVARIGGASPRLDAELLLSHVTGLSRTRFRAWPEQPVPADQVEAFERLVADKGLKDGVRSAVARCRKATDMTVTPDAGSVLMESLLAGSWG